MSRRVFILALCALGCLEPKRECLSTPRKSTFDIHNNVVGVLGMGAGLLFIREADSTIRRGSTVIGKAGATGAALLLDRQSGNFSVLTDCAECSSSHTPLPNEAGFIVQQPFGWPPVVATTSSLMFFDTDLRLDHVRKIGGADSLYHAWISGSGRTICAWVRRSHRDVSTDLLTCFSAEGREQSPEEYALPPDTQVGIIPVDDGPPFAAVRSGSTLTWKPLAELNARDVSLSTFTDDCGTWAVDFDKGYAFHAFSAAEFLPVTVSGSPLQLGEDGLFSLMTQDGDKRTISLSSFR